MPDPLFQTLFDETDRCSWAPVDVVGDRARRQARRTRAAALAAAILVVGVVWAGVGWARDDLSGRPKPGVPPGSLPPSTASPTPSPSMELTTPPPSTDDASIVDAMFVQPSDLGPGSRVDAGSEVSGDWTFEFSASVLGCLPTPATPWPIVRRDRTLTGGTQDVDGLAQYVARYRPWDAARYLDDVRARVSACNPDSGMSIKVGAERFAGEDALLIEVNYGGGSTATHVLIRQNDLLTELFSHSVSSNAEAVALGRTAAFRLCKGSSTC